MIDPMPMIWAAPADAQRYGSTLLVGELVRFRPLEDGDLDDLVRWWGDPEWAVQQQAVVRPRPKEPVVEMFRNWSKNEPGGEVGFSVVGRDSSELVGHVVLFGASLPVRAATLAVMIGSEHVGRGYGTDAVRLLTDYGFREMGVNRIEVQVYAFNERARATYRKVGYREEGVRREAAFHDGGFQDEVIMSALAREWPAGPPSTTP